MFKKSEYVRSKREISQNSFYVIAGLLLLLGIFLRFYQLTQIPHGVHVDEAGMGYDAYCLAQYGVDRYLNHLPVYMVNFGRGQSALYAYLCALVIKITGGELTVLAMRLPGAIFGILTIIYGTKIVQKFAGNKAALLAMGLLTICPYFIMQSRFGLDCNLLLGMSTISIYSYLNALEKKGVFRFIITGVLFGLTLYTYALSYWVFLFFIIFSSIYLLVTRQIKFWELAILGVFMGIFALPLILFVLINSLQLDPIVTPFFTIPRLSVYDASFNLSNIGNNLLTILKTILTKDSIPYNAFEQHFTLYIVSIPFVVLGFAIAIKDFVSSFVEKEHSTKHLLLFFFVSVLLMGCILGGDGPNINKLNGIYFTLVYFVVIAMMTLCRWLKKAHAIVMSIIIVIYAISFGSFANYYFNDYTTDIFPQYLFEETCQDAIEFVEQEGSGVFTFIDYTAQGYIYYLVGSQLAPFDVQTAIGNNYYENKCFSLDGQVLEDCSYIVKKKNDTFLNQISASQIDFQTKEFGDYIAFYRESR